MEEKAKNETKVMDIEKEKEVQKAEEDALNHIEEDDDDFEDFEVDSRLPAYFLSNICTRLG